MRVNSLPYGCSVTRVRGGVTYYYCGNIWYEPVYQRTTVTGAHRVNVVTILLSKVESIVKIILTCN